ncbi:MAG: HAMP domain-containing sensor histidine kinase [bacterium]|nr:HAMP domain-containing sensor histidine kinase [bacterium]
MKIKSYFRRCNLVMLAVPAAMILLVSALFLALFILKFPVEQLYVTRIQLLNPVLLFDAALKFLSENPMAVGYIVLWLVLCVIITVAATFIATSKMSKKITSSIEELTEAAERVKGGNLAFEIIGSDMEEIDELCVSFDEMRCSLMSAEKNEAALKNERSMMIANISHDLKTPVTSIKGYVDAINDGLASNPETLRRYLGVIRSKANSIESLINNMSTMSRIEMSRLTMNFDEGEINDLVYETAAEYRADAELAGLALETALTSEPAPVRLDYEKFRRVLINLIENSIKYRRAESKKIRLVTENAENGVYVRVIDDGIGIEKEELNRIYDSFYRIDEARTAHIKGSGLGLGIAKELVKLHGGRLWLVSEGRDKGTTANIYLPYALSENNH